MRALVLLLTLATITLHACFGCWVFHVHAHEAGDCASVSEMAHGHAGHFHPPLEDLCGDHEAPPAPCEGPATPHDDCGIEPCVFAHGVRVDVSQLLLAVITPFFEPSAPATVGIPRLTCFESSSFRLASPLRSHLLLSILLL